MNKLELIHYLQSLLATCNTLYDLQEKLIEDEIVEKADIKIRQDKIKKGTGFRSSHQRHLDKQEAEAYLAKQGYKDAQEEES